jgi:hypothetical protein
MTPFNWGIGKVQVMVVVLLTRLLVGFQGGREYKKKQPQITSPQILWWASHLILHN